MDYTKFVFVDQEVLVKLIEDPLDTSKALDDILEATVVNKGANAVEYEIGDKVLVRRDHARDLKSPHFPKDIKIVPTEKYITCKFPK
jgi:hypothetical protein